MYHFNSEKSDRTVLEGRLLIPYLCFQEAAVLDTLPAFKLVSTLALLPLNGSSFTKLQHSKFTPTFFIHQSSFISVVLSSALTCHAMPQIIHRTDFQYILYRGCRRNRSVSQNSLIIL